MSWVRKARRKLVTDTLMQPDVHIVITQQPGVDGVSSPAQIAQIESDLADVKARPVIASLTDLQDVTGTPMEGDTIVYDAVAGEWETRTFAATIQTFDGVGNPVNMTTRNIYAGFGMGNTVPAGDPFGTMISVVMGTTANTVAAGNHAHTNPLPVFEPFNATGYMSGSSRTVVSKSVTLAADITYVVIARFRPQLRGADSGAAYYTLTTTIAGNPKTSPGGATSGFWCVQGVPNNREWVHAVEIVGTGTSITVTGSVAYYSGSGFNVDAGELEIELKPNK